MSKFKCELEKLKKILSKIIKDKQLLTIIILMLAVTIIGIIVIGFLKTFIIMGSLILIAFIIKFITDKKNKDKYIHKKNRKTYVINKNDDITYLNNLMKERKNDDVIMKKGMKKINKNKKTIKKENNTKIISKIITAILILMLVGILLAILFLGYVVVSAPDFNPTNLYRKESSIVYDNKGNVIAKLGSEKRKTITYSDMPEVLIDAIIATEDSRFFQHDGVDLPRFSKAVVGQLLGRSGAGGGSTITMQVSKNAYTDTIATGIKGIIRKFTDIYIAMFKLEKKYSKEQILEYYVNIPDLSSNSFGVAEAAETYFGKDVSELNLSEAALIAGLFQAPTAYNPYLYPKAATERRAVVLRLMKRHGYITSEEEEMANAISVESLLGKRIVDSPYQNFIDEVVKEIQEKTGDSAYNTPMKIYTTLDKAKQDHMNKVINGELYTWHNDKVQVGVAVVDNQTGAILALSGGRNTVALGFNRATDLNNQLGSAAKPLFDYGPGIEYNNWSTYTPFIDEAWSYSNGAGIKNWDDSFYGFLTLKRSLGLSRNVPALKAFQNVNNKNIYDFVTSLGIKPEVAKGDTSIHEAHSLGAFNGVSPLQVASAYAAFGNGGYYIKPYTVTKIVYLDTNQTKEYKPSKTKVMSDATAYLITNSLIWAVEGGVSSGSRIYGRQVAAKTGTTNFSGSTFQDYGIPYSAVRDYWVAGYTPKISMAMWYGYDKITDGYNTLADNSRKDKVYSTILRGIVDDSPKNFPIPSSVVAVSVENGTVPAMLPSEGTPSNMITTEYFKAGTEPTDVSPRFQKLSNPSGFTVSISDNKAKLSWKAVSVPAYYTDEWMNSHIKNGYGDRKDRYIKYRTTERDTLGDFGYDIYISNNGSEKYISTTTETNATLDITSYSGDIKFIVRTAWSKNKSTISSGSEFTVKKEETPVSLVNVNLKGNSVVNLNLNDTYVERSVVVLDNFVDVTSSCSISYIVTNSNNVMLSEVDTSVADTYKVKYKIEYNGNIYEKTRTVVVTDNNSNNDKNES